MSITAEIAKHLRGPFFGGNWTTVNLRETLADVTWQQATRQVESFNTIATLTFHVSYYIDVLLKVLRGGPLDAHDKYSFQHPPIESAEDWDRFRNKVWSDLEDLAAAVEAMPEEKLWETMVDEKFGSYYRNIHGIIEHTHYHLGQITLIKKLIARAETAVAEGTDAEVESNTL